MKTIILALLGVAGPLVLMAVAVAAVGFLDARPPASREQCDKLAQQGNLQGRLRGLPGPRPRSEGRPRARRHGPAEGRSRAWCSSGGRRDRRVPRGGHRGPQGQLAAAPGGGRELPERSVSITASSSPASSIAASIEGGGRYVGTLRARPGPRPAAPGPGARSRPVATPIARAPGVTSSRSPRPCSSNRTAGESWRLQSLTPLDVLPDYEEDAAQLWGGQAARRPPSSPTGRRSTTACRESFEKAKNDGERWRWALAQAVEIDPGLLNATRVELADFLLEPVRHPDDRRVSVPGAARETAGPRPRASTPSTRSRTTRPSPGWPPASSGSSCPTSSTRSRSTRRSPTIPKTGQGEAGPRSALATIFENRRQFDRAAELPETSKDVYGDTDGSEDPAARPDRRQLGPVRAAHDPARRPGRDRRLPLPQRPTRPLRGPRDPRRQAAERREGLPRVAARRSSTGSRSTSATSAIAWSRSNQKQYLGGTVARWDLDLKPLPGHVDKRITVTTPLQKAGAYLLTARMDGRQHQPHRRLARRHGHRQEADGREGRTTSSPTPSPASRSPRPTSSSSAGGSVQVDGQERVPRRDQDVCRSRPTTTASSWFPTADLADRQDITSGSSPRGRRRAGFAYLGFTHDLAGQLLRPGVQPGQGLHDHRPAGLSARADGAVQVLGAPRPVRPARRLGLRRQDRSPSRSTIPRARRSSTKSFTADEYGGFDGVVRAAVGRDARASTRSSCPNHGRRHVPRRGVQEARVRGERRGPDRAGDARREDHGDDQGEVLLRLAGRQGQGQVQGHPHHGRRALVSRRPAGTGSTAPATGGSPPTTPGIPAGREWGCLRPVALVVGPPAAARPRSSPRPRCRSGPTARSPSRSTRALAKELHRDQDHQYTITAEVIDESRRTIVGTGNVLVARKPFTVYTWVDRGHYRAGDTIEAELPGPDARPQAGRRQGRR